MRCVACNSILSSYSAGWNDDKRRHDDLCPTCKHVVQWNVTDMEKGVDHNSEPVYPDALIFPRRPHYPEDDDA